MDKKQNSECWYKDVCTLEDSCSGCIRFLEMNYLMLNSGIPKSKQLPTKLFPEDIDYDAFVRLDTIRTHIVDFVDNGNNLFICSTHPGNGKTSWAIKLMLRYFHEVWLGNGFKIKGLFVHVPTLLFQLKNFQDPVSTEYKQCLLNTNLVIFDDISESNLSNYDYSNLLTILDGRMLYNKSNIFTSNQTRKEDLEDILGVRLASRIYNTSEIIELKGKDKRHD